MSAAIGLGAIEKRNRAIVADVAAGLSYGAIAERYPELTRNAVASIVKRARDRGALPEGNGAPFGLRGRNAPRSATAIARPKAERAPIAAAVDAPPAEPPVLIKFAPALMSTQAERAHRTAEFERMTESRGCKWPVGDLSDPDFHYCCAPRPSVTQPYCEAHAARAWTPSKPRRPYVVGQPYAADHGETA